MQQLTYFHEFHIAYKFYWLMDNNTVKLQTSKLHIWLKMPVQLNYFKQWDENVSVAECGVCNECQDANSAMKNLVPLASSANLLTEQITLPMSTGLHRSSCNV